MLVRSAGAALALAALLAGCLAPGEGATSTSTNATVPTSVANVTVALPFEAAARLWFPETAGFDLAETILMFPVNASGFAAKATVAIGMAAGPIDLPLAFAYVEADLVDPDGEVLDTGRAGVGMDMTLELAAADLRAGQHTLVLRTGGGSDGEANGDYLDWTLDAR